MKDLKAMIRELTLAAALTLAAIPAGAQQAYRPIEGVCNSSSFWRDRCSTVKTTGKTPAVSCEKGSVCKVATDGTPFDQEFDKRIWWQSCALSQKCSDWVRGDKPIKPSDIMGDINQGTTFVYPATPCVQNGDTYTYTYTCSEGQTLTIAPPPPDSSWHIQIRRGGLTHANCEDIKKGAEAEGATAECFQ